MFLHDPWQVIPLRYDFFSMYLIIDIKYFIFYFLEKTTLFKGIIPFLLLNLKVAVFASILRFKHFKKFLLENPTYFQKRVLYGLWLHFMAVLILFFDWI